MIRPLRRRHRRWMILLAVAAPVLFVAGLASRPPAPVMPRLVLEDPAQPAEPASWSDRRFHGARIRTARLAAGGPQAGWVLEPLEDVSGGLLYHAPADTSVPASGLPEEAVLLGRLAAPRAWLRLPERSAAVMLLIYDLDRQQVTARADLPGGSAS